VRPTEQANAPTAPHPAGLLLGVCLAALLPVRVVHADLPTRIDITRVGECAAKHPAVIEVSEALNDAARELSLGSALKAALDRVNYSGANAEALYLKNPMNDLTSPVNDDAVREIIEDRYCTAGDSRPFTEVGIYRSSNETWLVFATPIELPRLEDPVTVAARVLELVNTARQRSRRCGDLQMGAAPPLTLSHALSEAATRHASDMALQGSFGHVGSDGSHPSERASQAGYRWRAVGENIAAGQSGPDAVVTSWLDSPEHCANVMGAQFKEMGVAFALAPRKNPVIYWAQEFAAPR